MAENKVVAAAAPVKAPQGAPVLTPVKPPAFKITSMEEQNQQRYLKILIYGEYGIGKTTLAGTAAEVPQMQDVFLENIEAGDLSLSTQHGIDTVRVANFTTAARTADFLKAHCALRDADDEQKLRDLEEKFRGGPVDWTNRKAKRYRTCIVDSLTELDSMSMNRILGITDNMALDAATNVAEWGDFRQNYNLMQRLVRTYRDLPMNVIFICASQYNQDEMKRMNYSPQLTGKLAAQVQGVVDVVGYLRMDQAGEKIVRRLYVQPKGRFAAKCRFPEFKGDYFDEPTISGILKAVGLLQPTIQSK